MLALKWNNVTGGGADIVRNGGKGNFVTDDGFEAAVLISLFSDARASDDDELPTRDTDRRGYWADEFSTIPDDITGSKLWLLSRSKMTQETLTLAGEYAEEALRWFVADGIAKSVTASAEAVQPDMAELTVVIVKANNQRWVGVWRARFGG